MSRAQHVGLEYLYQRIKLWEISLISVTNPFIPANEEVCKRAIIVVNRELSTGRKAVMVDESNSKIKNLFI